MKCTIIRRTRSGHLCLQRLISSDIICPVILKCVILKDSEYLYYVCLSAYLSFCQFVYLSFCLSAGSRGAGKQQKTQNQVPRNLNVFNLNTKVTVSVPGPKYFGRLQLKYETYYEGQMKLFNESSTVYYCKSFRKCITFHQLVYF